MHCSRLVLVTILSCATLGMSLLGSGEAFATPQRIGMQHVGYRIIVEPEVVEVPRQHHGLVTKSLTWQLRSVYADSRGHELLVRPHVQRRPVRDHIVELNRSWRPGDTVRQSPDFADLRTTMKRFRRFAKATRPELLDTLRAGAARPTATSFTVRAAVPGARVEITPEAVEPPRALKRATRSKKAPQDVRTPERTARATCEDTLIAQGHHPQLLDNCKGVETACAVTLLEAGHHPQLLDNCEPGLSRTCTQKLLSVGHHPQLLDNCAGVRDRCAVALLDKGRHPQHLDACEP